MDDFLFEVRDIAKAADTISVIAAVDEDFGIGNEGQLPWAKVAADMQLFAAVTDGTTLIMGRKTVESLPRKLSNRTVIMISKSLKDHDYADFVAADFTQALALAKQQEKPIWIAGGESVYAESLPVATQLIVTSIPDVYVADRHFPVDDEDLKAAGFEVQNSYKLDSLDVNGVQKDVIATQYCRK